MARFPDLFIEVLDPLDFEPEERAPRPLDTPDSRPPTWLIDHPLLDLDPADLVPVTFSEGRGREGRGVTLPEPPPGVDPTTFGGADIAAIYRPWHYWGDLWGIYIGADALLRHTWHVAARASARAQEVAPFVLRQILSHERAHFAVEVGVTYMEDAERRQLYRPYMAWRFHQPNQFDAVPVEEAFATWREVRGRSFTPRFGRPPPRFLQASRDAASAAGPGYRDWAIWKANETECRRERAAAVAGDVRGAGSWFEVARDEEEQVPVYWVGDSSFSPRSAAFGRRPVSSLVRRLRSWLQRRVG